MKKLMVYESIYKHLTKVKYKRSIMVHKSNRTEHMKVHTNTRTYYLHTLGHGKTIIFNLIIATKISTISSRREQGSMKFVKN